MEEDNIREKITEIGKLLKQAGLIIATDGNISVKINNNILITPSGIPKWKMKKEDIVKIDMDGNVLEGNKKPSSEYKMHTGIYKERADVFSVIHTHSPYATAFAAAHTPIEPVVAEAVLSDVYIPVAPYAAPSTNEVPESIKDLIKKHNSILLANHGVVTVGKDLYETYYRAERVEYIAKIVLLSKILGGAKPLSKKDIEKIKKLWEIR